MFGMHEVEATPLVGGEGTEDEMGCEGLFPE